MSSCSVLGGIPVTNQGLNYLVPSKWWKEFVGLNKNRESSSFSVPPLNFLEHTDAFLLQFKDALVDELEFKSNYLKFNSIKISLQPSNNVEWTPISPALWKIINKTLNTKNGIFTILQQSKQQQILETTQIQIILCSKVRSQAFVGYVPKKASLIFAIREIGFELGFIEVENSKIAFLDKNPEVSFTFHEIQGQSIENASGSAFLAFNLERHEEDLPYFGQQQNMNVFDRLANQSNEAVVGDLLTMEDDSNNHLNEPINNRTMSTGAETPFSFAFSEGFDLDRQYRVKQLFGAKQPEEIEELKQLADKKLENQQNFIDIPEGDETTFQPLLDKLADELIESFLKKKAHKQKQKQFQNQ